MFAQSNAKFYKEKKNLDSEIPTLNYIFKTYDIYQFDASYVYKNLPNQKSEFNKYKYFITKGTSHFTAKKQQCQGYVYHYPMRVVVIADNPTKWLNSGLTLSDKNLIHEIAHIYTKIEFGGGDHSEDWVYACDKILKSMGLTDKILLNDLINDYGYRR